MPRIIVIAFVLAAGFSSIACTSFEPGRDQCAEGESYCADEVPVHCKEVDTTWGGVHFAWVKENPCGSSSTCKVDSSGPFCTYHPTRDAECDPTGSESSACVGDTLYKCRDGYIVGRSQCVGCTLSVDGGSHTCAPGTPGSKCKPGESCADGSVCHPDPLGNGTGECRASCACHEGVRCPECEASSESAGYYSVCLNGECTLSEFLW